MQILVSILLAILGLLMYLILVRPILQLLRLKIKYGDEIYVKLYPFFGQYLWEKNNEDRYGYTFEDIKNIMRENPKIKAIAFILGFRLCISSVDPELSKSILLENHTKIKKHYKIMNTELLMSGLILQDGDEWKQTRKAIADSFHFESLHNRFQIISKVIKERIIKFKQYDGKDYFPIFDEFRMMTGDLGIKIFFGPEFENFEIDGMPFSTFTQRSLENQFFYSKSSIYYKIKSYFLGDKLQMKFLSSREKQMIKENDKMVNIIRKIVEKKIKAFEENPESKSEFLVDKLIKAYTNKSIVNLTIEKICMQCAHFMVAAADPTGFQLGWLFYSLSEHRLEKEKVIQEINRVFPTQDSCDNMQFEDLKKLVYTQAFIDETQRKYNSVPGIVEREVIEPFKSGCFEFEKDDVVSIHLYGGFLNPRHFNNPEEFRVERFLNGNDKLINPYINIPFSAGPRSCIGKYIAQLELKLSLVYFLKNFNLERNEKVKLIYQKKFLVSPKDQNLVKITLK